MECCPRVDVALAVYGEPDKLDRCLTAFTANTHVPYKLWIVDDFSPDRFKKSLGKVYKKFSDYKTYPNIKIEKRPLNCGFGWSVNHAASKGSAEYILLLNSDVYVMDSCVDRMVEVLDTKPEVGVVGAKLLFPSDPRPVQYVPSYFMEGRRLNPEGAGLAVADLIQHAGVFFYGQQDGPRYNENGQDMYGLPIHRWGYFGKDYPEVCRSKYVPCVTGALLMTRRSIWTELGGMDWKTYKRGAYEDVHYNMAVRDMGHKIWYEANAVAYHHQWGSGVEVTHEYALDNRNKFLARWGERILPNGDLHVA